jgi:osmotically-inducible protein OsmY
MLQRKTLLTVACATALALGGPVLADDTAGEATGAVRDAWLDGKLETVYLLNRHLNNFAIETEVVDGKAFLKGAVESEVERDLATELAKGVEGITAVQNDLTVTGEAARGAVDSSGRGFMQRVSDATTTAAIKSKLLMNENTQGLQIDVDTVNDVVTLSGDVRSAEEKALAEQLARNADGVDAVNNNLEIAAH